MNENRSPTIASVVGRTHFDESQLQPHQREAIRAIRAHLDDFLLSAAGGRGEWGTTTPGSRLPATPWYERTDRPTQVISVFGERGQGKTATLFSLCRMLADNRAGRSEYLLVPVLDPELLGHGVDVFTAIGHNLRLALGQEQDASPQSHKEFTRLGEKLGEFVELSLAETSEGRALTADTAGTLEVYSKRTAARAAARMRRMDEFAGWVDEFLSAADRRLLVFPVDDVDVNREHSEQILQAVRLHLCHPRVVVILTADLEMIKRSIRNRLLKELPEVFTGGQAEAPTKKEDESRGFSLFGGTHRAHLLAQEYQADDTYAQQFLQKLLPPAYRVHLRGLRADERPQVRITIPALIGTSAGMVNESITDILAKAPLSSGMIDRLTLQPDKPPSYPLLREALAAAVADTAAPTPPDLPLLAALVQTYSAVFPSILRVLLNQMVTLRVLVRAYRSDIGAILASGSPSVDDTLHQAEAWDDVWAQRRIEWGGWLRTVTGANDGHAKLRRLEEAEDRFMGRVIECLAMHPDVQADRHLFFDHRSGANAFDGRTIQEFWSLTTGIVEIGTSTQGYLFEHRTPDGQSFRLSDSSSQLLNVVTEYAVARTGSFWPIRLAWQIDINSQLNFSLRRTLFTRWWAAKDRTGLSPPATAVYDHLAHSLRVESNTDDPDKVMLFLTPDWARWPAFITSLRDASRYQFAGLHTSNRRRLTDMINKLDSLPEALDSRSKKRRMTAAALRPALRQHERGVALRLLAVIAYKARETLNGVSAVSRYARDTVASRWLTLGNHTTAVSWYLFDLTNIGSMIAASLDTQNERSVANRFLTLLFIANQPVAPLLAAWTFSREPGGHPASLLQTVATLLAELTETWGESDVPVRAEFRCQLVACTDGHSPEARWEAPADGPTVVVKGLDGIVPPAFARDLAENLPECKLAEQVQGLELFVRVLLALQGRWDDHATSVRAPAVWDEFADRVAGVGTNWATGEPNPTDPPWLNEMVDEFTRSAEQKVEDKDDD